MKSIFTVVAAVSLGFGCAGDKALAPEVEAEQHTTTVAPPAREPDHTPTTAESYKWRVYCKYNRFRGYEECNMQAGGAPTEDELSDGQPLSFMWISWYSSLPDSYYVHIPNNDYRGFDPTLRVDSLAPISYEGEGAMFALRDDLLAQMRAGRFLYVTYYKWPYGKTNMVIDLIGFTAAHAQLQREVEKRQ